MTSSHTISKNSHALWSTRPEMFRVAIEHSRAPRSERVLRRLRPPVWSIGHGAGGVAWFYLECFRRSHDAEDLRLTDEWSSVAFELYAKLSTDAAHNIGLSPSVRRVSVMFGECGLHWLRAMTSLAAGQGDRADRATIAFIDAGSFSDGPADGRPSDYMFGLAGILIGALGLLSRTTGQSALSPQVRDALSRFGDELSRVVLERLRSAVLLRSSGPPRWLGVSHGRAGVLYALLAWARHTGASVDEHVVERLYELSAAQARPGVWPRMINSPDVDSWLGWCHGSAGYVHVWVLAHAVLGEVRWLRLAELAGVASRQAEAVAGLCCGSAGQCLALIRLYQHTRDERWLRRAGRLAEDAEKATLRSQNRALSLYRDGIGVGYVLSALETPDAARMPVFDWRA